MEQKNELMQLRQKIDEIDRQLVCLFEQRLSVTEQVGNYKKARNLPVLDAQREKQVLAEKAKLVQKEANQTAVADFFEAIMQISRNQQKKIVSQEKKEASQWLQPGLREPVKTPRIVFSGEPGAYGEEAAVLYFGQDLPRNRREDFEGVCRAIVDGQADYGVLPIENSSTGAITAVYDLLARYGCYIVGEQVVRVEHCLMAPEGATLEGITDVYSHEQGFFQSREFLKKHPEYIQHTMQTTATAAKYVAEEGVRTKGAIGSPRAAALYGLTILQERINFCAENYTRFVIVSPKPERRPESDKISALFTVAHESGSLHRIISVFAAHGLNLMKLESRPIPGRNWEYLFFVDFTGALTDDGMADVLNELKQYAGRLQILGNYPSNVDHEIK